MKLLGDWNWYLPSWLEWLPRIGGEGDAAGATARRAAAAAPTVGPQPGPVPV